MSPEGKEWVEQEQADRLSTLYAASDSLRLDRREERPDKGLCYTCVYGHVYRRRGYAHDKVYCSLLKKDMPDDIGQCTGHQIPNMGMDLDTMATLALPIEIRRSAGFR